MTRVLMVAEKPSLAKSIAEILSNGKSVPQQIGSMKAHLWSGPFKGNMVDFVMTSVAGHVKTTDFPAEFQSWEKNPEELFTCPIKKVDADSSGRVVRALQHAACGCGVLVLWLDCDREGENICFEVIDAVRTTMVGHEVHRAHFSSITPHDIRHAFDNLIKPNKDESDAVDARQEIDLRIGVAFTRFQTRLFQTKYGNLNNTVISYGPCQMPTLSFVVNRHNEIATFQPQPFWGLKVVLRSGSNAFSTQWDRSHVFYQDIAEYFVDKLKKERVATVISFTKKQSKLQRPLPLNTVEMLKQASIRLKMGPHETMVIAENLYINGYISYPRTESTAYSPHFDFDECLRNISGTSELGRCAGVLCGRVCVGVGGVDAGDHPPITPQRDGVGLSGKAAALYTLICRYFLASISQNATIEKSKAVFKIAGEQFVSKSVRVISGGFKDILGDSAKLNTELLPPLSEGAKVEVVTVETTSGMTSPPSYLTEAELIALMEQHGIGTDASIPVHINNICARNYAYVDQSSRTIIPTQLGIALIHGYYKIDPELVLPTVRSNIESYISWIAKGKAHLTSVVKHAIGQFYAKFIYFKEHVGVMDDLFQANFSTLEHTPTRQFVKCGKCRRYTKLLALRPPRVYCPTCDEMYTLPGVGTVKEFSGNVCPICNFELCAVHCGAGKRSYAVCPCCFNTPPLAGMEKGSGCNNCPHPTCPHAAAANTVEACTCCGHGHVLLDLPTQANWHASCNSCTALITLPHDAYSIHRRRNTAGFTPTRRRWLIGTCCDELPTPCFTHF